MASSLCKTVSCPAPFLSSKPAPRKQAALRLRSKVTVRCGLPSSARIATDAESIVSKTGSLFLSLAAALCVAVPPALAEARLPPIDKDPNRCERAYVGNTIGQANAVSDKVLDLRECNFTGKDLSGKTLSGALLKDAVLPDSKLRETVLTKAYAVGANFSGADMTNAVVDRVDFRNANLTNVKFVNAVITGVTFDGANLQGAVFEDALIGNEDAKRLCANPTLTGESRSDVGCRIK